MAEHVLHVRKFGQHLLLRARARAARMAALALLEADPAGVLVLDFDGVEVITNGFAAELVAELLSQQPHLVVHTVGTNHEVADAIATALDRYRIPTDRLRRERR